MSDPGYSGWVQCPAGGRSKALWEALKTQPQAGIRAGPAGGSMGRRPSALEWMPDDPGECHNDQCGVTVTCVDGHSWCPLVPLPLYVLILPSLFLGLVHMVSTGRK